MYEVDEKLKNLYRTDYFPARDTQLKKELKLYFPELDKTITNEKIYSESMKLTESICSESDLALGGCESSEFAITVAGVGDEIVGKKLIVTQNVDGQYEMPLGTYRVKSAKKKDDQNFKEILSYDRITDTDVDVSMWYNTLPWPQTVKRMRESLLNYLGIEFKEQNLINDTVSLEKTITPSQLLGRIVLKKLCEINAGFGRMGRNNKFKITQLSGIGLYPSETLYPAEDLFPAESGEYVTAGYIKANYEEYIIEPITAITIREDDEDTGVTEGTLENPYVISDNFLLYGKSSEELHAIAANILLQVKNKFYRPHSTTMIGLPYMEAGDAVTIITSTDAIETFIFQRTLSGIQVLRDEISATGNRYRDQKVSSGTEIQQLKGKTLRIQKNIDQLSIDMTDMEEGLQSQITLTAGQLQTQITDNKSELQSQITQTAGQLQTEITDNKNALESQITQTAGQLQTEITDNYNQLNSTITQTAGSLQTQITDNKSDANSQISQVSNQISFKVSRGDLSSELSLEPGQVVFNSNRLVINSTNLNLDANGNATFSGDIVGATITGSYGASFTSVSVRGTSSDTIIYGGFVECSSLSVNSINGGTPVTSSNPASALSDSGYRLNWSGSQCLFAWSGQNLGQSSYRWGTAYLSTAPSVSSDRNLKHDIEDLPNIYRELILKLKPVRFKYNDGDSGRYHLGFISQDVESVMQELGINALDFAGFIKSPTYSDQDENGVYDVNSEITGYIYMLRYEEFISPAISVIQEQEHRIKSLEERLENLESIIPQGRR